MKRKKLAFVLVLCVWLLTPERPSAGEFRCGHGTVTGQDNFDVRQGWYCSTAQNDSQLVCGTQTDVTNIVSLTATFAALFMSLVSAVGWRRSHLVTLMQ